MGTHSRAMCLYLTMTQFICNALRLNCQPLRTAMAFEQVTESSVFQLNGGGLVPLSHAICCRPCLPESLPGSPDNQSALAVVSLGCHASSNPGSASLRCESQGGSLVTGRQLCTQRESPMDRLLVQILPVVTVVHVLCAISSYILNERKNPTFKGFSKAYLCHKACIASILIVSQPISHPNEHLPGILDPSLLNSTSH